MATQSTEKITKKAFLTDLNIQFGVMEAVGTLYTPLVANAKKAEKFKMACPTCAVEKKAVGVAQRYVCSERDHGEDGKVEMFEPYECLKFKETDTGNVLIDAASVEAAKEATALPDKTLILTAHAASEVNPYLVHTGSTYVFQPKSESNFFGVLLRIVGEDGCVQTETGPKVLMGEMLVRKEEKIVRVNKWNGQIVLEEVARPEDIDTFQPSNAEVPDKLAVLTRTLIETGTEEFKPEEYKKSVRDRYAALVASAQSGESAQQRAKKTKAPKESADDLIAKLEAAIAANTP